MDSLPMFPLGSVLFPHMPLALRVFEDRYLVLMARVLSAEAAEFGVVLIERGLESGTIDNQYRFGVGTVARVTQLGRTGENLAVIARGERRVEVIAWLDDDPHPEAIVRDLPDLEWDASLDADLERAEQIVRRSIAQASEFVELAYDADVELDDDPTVRAWQLAGIAPIGPLDQFRLLRATTMRGLLDDLVEAASGAAEVLTSGLAFGDGDDGDDDLLG